MKFIWQRITFFLEKSVISVRTVDCQVIEQAVRLYKRYGRSRFTENSSFECVLAKDRPFQSAMEE